MTNGETLEGCAKRTSHEAAREFGTSGFQYGCAVSMLSQAWSHGEALRRWSNLEIQIGNEGEKANEAGGVLNPALMTFTVKEKQPHADRERGPAAVRSRTPAAGEKPAPAAGYGAGPAKTTGGGYGKAPAAPVPPSAQAAMQVSDDDVPFSFLIPLVISFGLAGLGIA